MRRFVTAIVATLVTVFAVASAQTAELTPEAAYTLVARDTWSKDPFPKPEELAAARKVLEAQAKREPQAARWTFALARAASIEADQAQGDSAKDKRKEALQGFEHAVELAPGNADYQYWFASASIERVDDVGMLSKMSRQYTLAETAGGVGADPVAALRSLALQLLTAKKDPQAAAPLVERYLKVAPADDVTAWYLDAEVKRQLGHCADALPRYDRVLAERPEARGSRWGAAVCHDQLGQKDAARRDYEEFVRRFPNDDRAKDAKAALKRLAGS